MIKGQTYSNQLFENWAYRLTLNTLLDGNNGVLEQYGSKMEVTNSGNNIVVGSGVAIVQGGIIENTSDLTLTPQLEANTFFRVIIEIDMSQTNTTSEFKQGTIKLLSDTGDYPTLTQQDTIQGEGKYQYELARFQTTSSAIQNLTDARTFLNYNSLYQKLSDEIDRIIEDGISASQIDYDNSTSGMASTDLQGAIDELQSAINDADSDISNIQTAIANVIKYSSFAITSHGSGSISNGNGGAGVKDIAVSKAGYYPLGIVGYTSTSTNHYNNTSMGACLQELYLSARSNGACTIHGRTWVKDNSAWTYSSSFTAYVLWVKI